MKILIAFSSFLLAGYVVYGQSSAHKVAKIRKSEIVQTLKDVALCECVYNSFKSDSLISKDPSIFVMLDVIDASYEVIPKLDSFTFNYVQRNPIAKPGQHKESTAKRRAMYDCITLYKSKELTEFVEKLYREYFR